MTTEQYIKRLEKNAKILEIRALMEDDPVKEAAIQKRVAKRYKTIETLRKLWRKDGIQYATLEHAKDDDEE